MDDYSLPSIDEMDRLADYDLSGGRNTSMKGETGDLEGFTVGIPRSVDLGEKERGGEREEGEAILRVHDTITRGRVTERM